MVVTIIMENKNTRTYNMLTSKNKNHIIEEIIEKFERNNNFTLPESYKEFLLRYNGGV